MCPASDAFARPLEGVDATTPIGQGVMMSVVQSGMLDVAWSSNSDYAFNEGLFGFHYNPRYATRRFSGNIAKQHHADQLVLFSDAQASATPAYAILRDFHYGWICWRPALDSTGPVTLADAFLNNGRATSADMFDKPRHRLRINVAFADGHVKTMGINEPDLRQAFLLPP
jgi:prepilin-type processing-associated H-X9-DG protein